MYFIFYKLLDVLAILFSFIIPLKLIYSMRYFKDRVVTNSIKRTLKKHGKNIRFHRQTYIKNPQFICIGDNFSSIHNLRIEAYDSYQDQMFSPEIIIGDNVGINADCHIGCINRVEIKNNVLIGSRVLITDHSHGNPREVDIPPVKRPLVSKGQVLISENVWIGEGACVLAGVTIGKNSIIGANSVVTKDIPENSIAVGSPAKILRSN